MSRMIRPHLPALQKTASYYVLHIVVAAGVGYAVTGSFWMALTLSLLEPTVQAVAFFFHEKVWERRQKSQQAKQSALAQRADESAPSMAARAVPVAA